MRNKQNKAAITHTGKFDNVKLSFTPDEPLSDRERYKYKANYPTTQAKIHMHLNGEDVLHATTPGYVLYILQHFLESIDLLIRGQSISVSWVSDAWQFDIDSLPKQGIVLITVHIPDEYIVAQSIEVPLFLFCEQIIAMAKEWVKHLKSVYPQEISDPKFNQPYLQLNRSIDKAIKVLNSYSTK